MYIIFTFSLISGLELVRRFHFQFVDSIRLPRSQLKAM